MDTSTLRYGGMRYRYKSLAGTANSIVHGTGDHVAWDTVLLLLAQTRSALRSPCGENCSAWCKVTHCEPEELLRRAETAERLQSCDRVRCRGVATDAGRESDFSVLRDSELGRASCGVAAHYRISRRDDSRLGV